MSRRLTGWRWILLGVAVLTLTAQAGAFSTVDLLTGIICALCLHLEVGMRRLADRLAEGQARVAEGQARMEEQMRTAFKEIDRFRAWKHDELPKLIASLQEEQLDLCDRVKTIELRREGAA